MRAGRALGLATCLTALVAALPARANRLTFEVWPDASPDHAISCTFALSDGWISLVQVKGAGMPNPQPMRWRASQAEVEALSDSLQALIGGELHSTDPTGSREPPAPFLTVTWMTRLDGTLASGLYMQPGLLMPGTLSNTLDSLGLNGPCGLIARAAE
jgi:hypothetical protein